MISAHSLLLPSLPYKLNIRNPVSEVLFIPCLMLCSPPILAGKRNWPLGFHRPSKTRLLRLSLFFALFVIKLSLVNRAAPPSRALLGHSTVSHAALKVKVKVAFCYYLALKLDEKSIVTPFRGPFRLVVEVVDSQLLLL